MGRARVDRAAAHTGRTGTRLRLGASDSGNDPAKQTTRHAYDLLAAGFGSGFNGPLQLAVRLPAASDTAGLARFATALRRTPGIASVAAPRLNPARDTAAIAVYPTTSPQSAQTTSLVKRLRSDVLPRLAKATGTTVYVGGATATQVDFARVLSGKLPLFIGLVVLLSTLLLHATLFVRTRPTRVIYGNLPLS